jgi:spermidine synthase
MKKNKNRADIDQPIPAPGTDVSRSFLIYLLVTAVLCGALIMVIEILGSRVIGPFFGVSLFVWTSLITVTLVALAAGYAVGGILSDRKNDPAVLYLLILAAGLLSLLVPVLKGPVLRTTVSWGLRTGAFASAFALFGPALFLLGCVSPYLVRLAAKEMRNIGRTVGLFYALSTVGSFLGTILTGFLFIAYLRVSVIFFVVGGLLLALAAGYFIFFRRAGYVAAALALLLVTYPAEHLGSKVLPNGVMVRELYDRDSFYGNLKVIEYSFGEQRHRDLLIDGLTQGGIDVASGLPLYEYAYHLQLLPYSINPNGRNCLVIGLGAGLVPRWFEQRGVATDVVDIDPHVVDVARRYFGFSNTGEVILADARHFLNSSRKRYDYIVLDVFNGDTTPGHLLSIEALRLVRERLTDQGILAINLIGSLKRYPFMTLSVIRTLQEVFGTVSIYPNYDVAEETGGGNITVLAYEGPQRPLHLEGTLGFPMHPSVQSGVSRFLGKQFHLPASTPAMVLTDDHNPIDFFDRDLKEWVRQTIRENTDVDLLL